MRKRDELISLFASTVKGRRELCKFNGEKGLYMLRTCFNSPASSFKDQSKQTCVLNDFKAQKDCPSPEANKKLTCLLTIEPYNISP